LDDDAIVSPSSASHQILKSLFERRKEKRRPKDSADRYRTGAPNRWRETTTVFAHHNFNQKKYHHDALSPYRQDVAAQEFSAQLHEELSDFSGNGPKVRKID
jgi:hypothetical protein